MTTLIRQLSNFYGDMCGYGRGRIRLEAARSSLMSAEELEALSGRLFQSRVRATLQRFPLYADAVHTHCGRLPAPGRRILPADLPVWTRHEQRTLFASLQGPPVPGAFVHATGGSTGEPTRFYVTRESYEWRTAVSDRGYSWASAEEGRKSYYVWGSPIKPMPALKKLKVQLEHTIQRREYFDSFVFNDERKAACCREINRFRPPALVGYAGNLVDLALYVRRKNHRAPHAVVTGVSPVGAVGVADAADTAATTEEAQSTCNNRCVGGTEEAQSTCSNRRVGGTDLGKAPDASGPLTWKARSLVTGAEGLQPGQRELLQETLADEVFMSYGSREFMLIGMECSQHRGYHISSDNLYVEVVDERGRPVAPGQTGRILVTDLRNEATPFIRYEIGDMGAMAAEPCSCGLPFPLLARVEGRIQEFLFTPAGDKMTALFIPHLMKEFTWVQGYQIDQDSTGAVRVNVLSDHEPARLEVAPLVAALQAKLGAGAQVEVVRVDGLEKSASGKVPIVVRR